MWLAVWWRWGRAELSCACQLYSIAIEPLLCRLRSRLRGLSLPGLAHNPPVVVSAYADDVNVFIHDQHDVQQLQESLVCYGRASSARVNWEKSEGFLMGQWSPGTEPGLPGNLQWGRNGIKVLGVHLGSEGFQRQNWEGVREKVEAKLSKWKWLLHYLSNRGRVLIVNNLVVWSLWHRLIVVVPPPGLVEDVQRRLVTFFWSGQHWLRAPALISLWQREVRDSLTLCLELRPSDCRRWRCCCTDVVPARLLLRQAGRLGLDKQLFLLSSTEADLTGWHRSTARWWTPSRRWRSSGLLTPDRGYGCLRRHCFTMISWELPVWYG